MEGFIKFILVAFIALFVLGQIGRWALRYWLWKKQREFARHFGQGTGFGQPGEKSQRGKTRREGEVSVQQTVNVEKKVNKEVGDYVEFEEVEITEETGGTE